MPPNYQNTNIPSSISPTECEKSSTIPKISEMIGSFGLPANMIDFMQSEGPLKWYSREELESALRDGYPQKASLKWFNRIIHRPHYEYLLAKSDTMAESEKVVMGFSFKFTDAIYNMQKNGQVERRQVRAGEYEYRISEKLLRQAGLISQKASEMAKSSGLTAAIIDFLEEKYDPELWVSVEEIVGAVGHLITPQKATRTYFRYYVTKAKKAKTDRPIFEQILVGRRTAVMERLSDMTKYKRVLRKGKPGGFSYQFNKDFFDNLNGSKDGRRETKMES